MRLVRRSRLTLTVDGRAYLFEVELVDNGGSRPARFVVNTTSGQASGPRRSGTRTSRPVELARAERIFDSVVVAQQNRGYRLEGAPAEASAAQPTSNGSARRRRFDRDRAVARIVEKLEEARAGHVSGRARRRAIWRAGELMAAPAGRALTALGEGVDDALEAYSVAWAIGRAVDPDSDEAARAIAVLEAMVGRHGAEMVRRQAVNALVAVAPDHPVILPALLGALPPVVAGLADAGDPVAIGTSLSQYLLSERTPGPGPAHAVYLLGRLDPRFDGAIETALERVPAEGGRLPGFRAVMKAAEFFLDADIFGLTARIVERGSPASGMAPMRSRTQLYLRRRLWRILRKLALIGDAAAYVDLATGLLLALRPEDQSPVTQVGLPPSRRRARVARFNGPLASQSAASRVLFGASRRARLVDAAPGIVFEMAATDGAWQPADGTALFEREEAYRTLWDQQPGALWQLATSARIEPVHAFAARALRDHAPFVAKQPAEELAELIRSPFVPTATLAAGEAVRRIAARELSGVILIAAADSILVEARALVRDALAKGLVPRDDTADVWAAAIASPHDDLATWTREGLIEARLDTVLKNRLVDVLLSRLEAASDRIALATVERAGWHLAFSLAEAVGEQKVVRLVALTVHPVAAIRAVATSCLAEHPDGAWEADEALMQRLLHDADSAVRAAAVRLLGRLSDQDLLARGRLLGGLLASTDEPVRDHAAKLIQRLIAGQGRFAQAVFASAVGILSQPEDIEGSHARIVDLLDVTVLGHLPAFDLDQVWRLATGDGAGGQLLAARLLRQLDAGDFPIPELVVLTRVETADIRAWALAAIAADPARLAADIDAVLGIVETDWEDTREDAFRLLEAHVPDDAWTADRILALTDSARPAVQGFGRRILTEHFDEHLGPEYLVRLAEHPDPSFALLVTQLLDGHAGGAPDRLLRLEPALKTLLARVNLGRPAKDRVIAFLEDEVPTSREAAAVAARVFAFLSASPLVTDRADGIRGLAAVARHWPDLPGPLKPKTRERRRADAPTLAAGA